MGYGRACGRGNHEKIPEKTGMDTAHDFERYAQREESRILRKGKLGMND